MQSTNAALTFENTMGTGLTQAQEAELQERDEKVRIVLTETIRQNEAEIDDLRDRMNALIAANKEIRDSVADERWHALSDYLDAADVESLCAVSPSGLLDD